MPFLPDGTCIPSWLSVSDAMDRGAQTYEYSFNNTTLRRGYTVGIHYPGDKGYEKVKDVLYDVAVQASLGHEAEAWQVYRNVGVGIRLFGSKEEYTRFSIRTPRATWDSEQGLTAEILAESSCVLVECEDGRSDKSKIVGFWEHPDTPPDDKELGHYWKWAFNGISQEVNKDGEYSVEFTGAILDPNTNFHVKAPENTTGTYFKFTKEGGWLVDDVKGESITLDKAGKKLSLAGRNIDLASQGTFAVTAKGNASIVTQGNLTLEAGKTVTIKGEKVKVGKGNEPMVLGHKLWDALDKLMSILLASNLSGNTKIDLMKWKMTENKKYWSRKGFLE